MVDVPYGRKIDKTVDGPKNKWKAITPSDTVALDPVPCAVHCSSSTGGNFTAVDEDDNAEVFYTQPGQYHPIRPRRINLTDLTEGLTFNGLYD
jgi:hypothetical protein